MIVNADTYGKGVTIKTGDEWRYFKGTSEPPDKWHFREFDDSHWDRGTSGFGYGTEKPSTVLDDMKGNYRSIYVRKTFTMVPYDEVKEIKLTVVCDGPFIAYLNMIEAIRGKKGRGDALILSGFAHELSYDGANVLSIKCSNDDVNSDKFLFIPAFEVLEK